MPADKEEEDEEDGALQADGYRGAAGDLDPDLDRRVAGIRGGGRPLPGAVRQSLEPRFGFDFSHVRIHTDQESGAVARKLGARAFTVGRDIVFGPSTYAPHSRDGRHLLAHELTHVVQQSAGTDGSANSDVVRRAPTVEADPAVGALKTAVEGDDNDVRALIDGDFWSGVTLRPAEAAQLLDNLLTGATLDEDEKSGLKVLGKAKDQSVLDGTLLELDARGRFRKLLDDYHGAEYHTLLELLSRSIDGLPVKAIYLDAFIAMWWVRKHEEQAIVVLLERTSGSDLAALLAAEDRQAELRSAIDADDLSQRFETIASQVNVTVFGDISGKLRKIFEITARPSTGSKTQAGKVLSEDDINQILAAAAADLASELQDYKDELAAAIAANEHDKVTKINRHFEARIAKLLNSKRRELKYELRWDVEFNRGLDDAYGRQWSEGDLQKIDELLAKIPPEILYANPDFKGFRREKTHPKHGGFSSESTGFVTLSGGTPKLSTTAHELGHFAHFADAQMFDDFQRISAWQPFTKQNFRMFIADEKTRKRILRKLDRHRKNEERDKTVTEGNFIYRYDRYGGNYYRYRADAKFITDYAKTDPQDDFAESFETYLLHPEDLEKAAPKKYAFMHKRVFVQFWLEQQAKVIVKRFDAKKKERIDALSDRGLGRWLDKNHLHPLKQELEQELDDLKTEKVDAADLGLLTKPVPLKGSTESATLGQRFFTRLDRLMDLAEEVKKRHHKFAADADALRNSVAGPNDLALFVIVLDLKSHSIEETRKAFDGAAAKLKAGAVVDPAAWPELDAVVAKLTAALAAAQSYVPYFEKFLTIQDDWNFEEDLLTRPGGKDELDPMAVKELGRFAETDYRHGEFKDFIVTQRQSYIDEFDKIEDDLKAMVRAGTVFKPGALPDPAARANAYRKTVRAYGRSLRKRGNAP
ncbi:MAG: DUF4157 domain-containing protein [Alphaproteobacteria bacterium]|nr:DUF4157 domain-containing protein [Alphaproteobacteria bacterium]